MAKTPNSATVSGHIKIGPLAIIVVGIRSERGVFLKEAGIGCFRDRLLWEELSLRNRPDFLISFLEGKVVRL
jgi:hypothetical protein